MARSIDDRLLRLKNRRLSVNDEIVLAEANRAGEAYTRRSQNKATQYALGAMQQVDPRSTQISNEEAEKVERNLRDGLKSEGLYPNFRMQGSVPLNVHIRGASDVDLLVLEGTYLQTAPCPDSRKSYTTYTGRGTLVDDVLYLRRQSVSVLKTRFWGAKVDASPDKSIQLTEGGFRRKVDVVPASWFDTVAHQRTLNEADRGVDIVNRRSLELIRNFPFLYKQALENKDTRTNGGAKMAIRLAKNVKNDADHEIGISSYDIGSLIFSCPDTYIEHHLARDLAILSGTQRWIEELTLDYHFARSLDTPDNTRKIINDLAKWEGLKRLSNELTDLAAEVEAEIVGPFGQRGLGREVLRKNLNDRSIPLVPELGNLSVF